MNFVIYLRRLRVVLLQTVDLGPVMFSLGRVVFIRG